jgi:hypothetical protein
MFSGRAKQMHAVSDVPGFTQPARELLIQVAVGSDRVLVPEAKSSSLPATGQRLPGIASYLHRAMFIKARRRLWKLGARGSVNPGGG